MSTKNNPGAFRCYEAALPDEHIFTILARDPAGPATLLFWADERERLGKTENPDDLDRIADARRDADLMRDWRDKNLDPMGDGGSPSWKLVRLNDEMGGPIRQRPEMIYVPAEKDGTEAVRVNIEWLKARTRDLVAGQISRSDYAELIDLACQSPDRRRDFMQVEEAEDSLLYRLEGAIHSLRDGRLPAPYDLYRAVKKQVQIEGESPWTYEVVGIGLSDLETAVDRLRRTPSVAEPEAPVAVKVDDRMSEPLGSAMEAARRLHVEIAFAELHGLAARYVEQTKDESPQHPEASTTWSKLRSFLSRNQPRGVLESKTGGADRAEAFTDLGTHYRAWRSAMTTLAMNAPTHLPDEDDYAYWCHEIRKLDHCFVTLGFIKAEAVPDMPVSRAEIEDDNGGDYAPVAGQERVLIDSKPDDLAHAPEVAPHRFSQFTKGNLYAYARGLEVAPVHLPVALDAMAADGWYLMAIFGATDTKNIGFIFSRRQFSAFEIAHGYGGGFDTGTRRWTEADVNENIRRFQQGEPLDSIRDEEQGGECDLGRGQQP